MIVVYRNIGDAVERVELSIQERVPSDALWIDLIEPTSEEARFIEHELAIDALTREEMDKMEVMSPFYKEEDDYYMTITVLHKPDTEYHDSTAVTIILKNNCVITMRYSKPRAFSAYSSRIMRSPSLFMTAEKVFEGMIESVVDRIADALERTGDELDMTLGEIFDITNSEQPHRKKAKRHSARHYNDVIKKIGRMGNAVSKNRESLQSINRMLIFYSQSESFAKRDYRNRFRVISREILTLTEYSNFLSGRNAFLLDATLGVLSVEQNSIIKVFTVAAAGFMPPTMIASIYGMNFHNIPELDWEYGYHIALFAIMMSILAPYLYFKRKGWI
jgi:magnesium transporter